MFLFNCCALLGSLFLLFSFLLHLFVMIGGVSDRTFLRDMYMDQVRNYGTNEVYNLNLWNACSGTIDRITSCGSTHQSYNWAHTPTVGGFLPHQYAPGGTHSGLFTALFSLVMAGVCLSFLIWILSFPLMFCCKQRRFSSTAMSTFTMLNLFCTIGAIVIGLILAISFNKGVAEGWSGRVGNSIWTLLGAMGSLLLGSFCFSGSCCFAGRSRRRRIGDTEAMASKPTNPQPWGQPTASYQTGPPAPPVTNQHVPTGSPAPPVTSQYVPTGSPAPPVTSQYVTTETTMPPMTNQHTVRPVHIPTHQ